MNVTPRIRQELGFESGQELRPVMLDNHDPVGPTILTFEGFEGHMAASGFMPEQIRGSWKHWPVVVFSEPDAD